MTPQEHEELAAAVAELGALPMPAGSDPKPEPVRKSRTMLDHARDALRARMAKDDLRLVLENTVAYAAELERQRNAFRDQRNSVFATNERLLGEVAESDQARLLAENETRTVRREADALRARVAELEAAAKQIRHLHTDSPMGPCPVCVDSDAMARGDDYTVPYPCPTARLAGAKDCDPPVDGISRRIAPTQALREDKPGACKACGSLPEEWCPDCAACKANCYGADGPCTHPNAPWGGAR